MPRARCATCRRSCRTSGLRNCRQRRWRVRKAAAKAPQVRGTPRRGCPVAHVGKIVAIALNYTDHAAAGGMPIPKEPIVFLKATSSIQGPNDPVMLPKGSVKTDWEVELGRVIGTKASYVARKDALSHVAGYCVVSDVSEREYQLERGPPHGSLKRLRDSFVARAPLGKGALAWAGALSLADWPAGQTTRSARN